MEAKRSWVAVAVGLVGLFFAPVPAAEAFVYWANLGDTSATGTTIGRAELNGTGVDQNFITGATGPCGVAVNATHVFWANIGSAMSGTGTIGRANLDGSLPDQDFLSGATVPCGVAFGSLPSGSFLYWANQGLDIGEGGIGRAQVEPFVSFVTQDLFNVPGEDADTNPCGVAVNATHIYWASDAIYRANVEGPPNISPIAAANLPCGVALSDSHVYWANRGDGTIGRSDLDGVMDDPDFVTGADAPCGVAVDGGHVYWANFGDGSGTTIGRAPLGNPDAADQNFITGADAPCGVAVDSLASPSPAAEPQPEPQPGDSSAPNATITKGPKDKTKKKAATFEFTGTDTRAIAGFQCKLDAGGFAPCTSPHTVKVKKGKHTFQVQAIDQAGNVGLPAADNWKVKRKKRK